MCDCCKSENGDLKDNIAAGKQISVTYRKEYLRAHDLSCELRKSVADLNETLEMRTEESDLARGLFKAMMNEYADLLGRYSKMCDDYESLSSLYEAEHVEF